MTAFDFITRNFARGTRRDQLPERVRAAIDERERANEIMARLIQLAIVLMFSVIYAISPKTSPDEAFSPVPYVLGAYLVVSIIGLIWSIRRTLPHWSDLRLDPVRFRPALQPDDQLPHPVHAAGFLHPQGADAALRVHIHRHSRAALRGALRHHRRPRGGRRLGGRDRLRDAHRSRRQHADAVLRGLPDVQPRS